MHPSFHNHLESLAAKTEAYIEQIRSEDPLSKNACLLTTSAFVKNQDTPLQPEEPIVQTKPEPQVLQKKVFKETKDPYQEPIAESTPPTIKEQPHSSKAPSFSLQKPQAAAKLLDEDIRKTFTKIAPHLLASCPIPSDEKARHIKNGWKEKHAIPVIPILASEQASLPFLTNVAQAITLHFFPARVLLLKDLEKQGLLPSLLDSKHVKLIISPDVTLWNCKELMKHYQEIPQQKQRFLKNTPLLLLPDPSLYLKDPSLKRSLWNLLCHLLKPLQP
jgi:hypothetical protein